MREFFKRALQLYRVPLTPEGEEPLRVHRNETRELVHMLLPLLTDKQMKTAAHAVGADSRAVYKVLQEYFIQGMLYGVLAGTEACRGCRELSDSVERAMEGFSNGRLENDVQSAEYRRTQERYEELCELFGRQVGSKAQALLRDIHKVNEEIIAERRVEYFTDGMRFGIQIGAEAQNLFEERE